MISEFPPADPRELQGLPVAFDMNQLFRVHLAEREPAHFGNRSLYRFDPPKRRQRDFGTCYIAKSREGAFLDALGGIRPLPEHLVNERVISEIHLVDDFKVADLTNESLGGTSNVHGDLSNGENYLLSQEWAAALWDAGYRGVQYTVRHNEDFRGLSVALFAEPGVWPDMFKCEEPEPIDAGLLDAVADYGVEVIPGTPILGAADTRHVRYLDLLSIKQMLR
jgi:hypothetical protein